MNNNNNKTARQSHAVRIVPLLLLSSRRHQNNVIVRLLIWYHQQRLYHNNNFIWHHQQFPFPILIVHLRLIPSSVSSSVYRRLSLMDRLRRSPLTIPRRPFLRTAFFHRLKRLTRRTHRTVFEGRLTSSKHAPDMRIIHGNNRSSRTWKMTTISVMTKKKLETCLGTLQKMWTVTTTRCFSIRYGKIDRCNVAKKVDVVLKFVVDVVTLLCTGANSCHHHHRPPLQLMLLPLGF